MERNVEEAVKKFPMTPEDCVPLRSSVPPEHCVPVFHLNTMGRDSHFSKSLNETSQTPLMAIADRWALVVAELMGEAVPPLPTLPGRVCRLPWGGPDLVAQAWDRLEQRTKPTDQAAREHHL